ncbi:MAG TPA: glycosyltransferase [Sulfuricurvum sp.]|nr:MAG: hypothetical protein B7Y30_09825 [Campylobacterales bacterium 16-40-21]OZA02312.1 MAG: hypothetical protein B7X89_09815 [Sulfuricurvum sp. 17-40-25]HQS67277.1 glycosyltransferase [Sulfuricurvum sp.]HQT36758.1 glycosyltransferase [Sulfuricurvum sp.]
MKQKVAFLTTIFPMNDEFLTACFDSLEKQTFKNFDIIVVNDGYKKFDTITKKYINLNIIELPYKNTPSKNREYGINNVKMMGYDIVVLGDSDDYFENNRIEKSLELLKTHDIVVNDLSLFDDNGVYEQKYISHRIQNLSIIDFDFILEKNIFGLSNTAIRLNLVDCINFDPNLIAVDWYLFSLLLLKAKHAIFTNETQTFYRQYSANTIGIGERTPETIKNILKVKTIHYGLMRKYLPYYQELYNNVIELDNTKDVSNLSISSIKHPFWWELYI